MAYTIAYHSAVAREDLAKLSREVRVRLLEMINHKIAVSPDIFGKPLRLSLRGYRSLRVGDYRIIYRIERTIVRIVAMRHRKDAYAEANRRTM